MIGIESARLNLAERIIPPYIKSYLLWFIIWPIIRLKLSQGGEKIGSVYEKCT